MTHPLLQPVTAALIQHELFWLTPKHIEKEQLDRYGPGMQLLWLTGVIPALPPTTAHAKAKLHPAAPAGGGTQLLPQAIFGLPHIVKYAPRMEEARSNESRFGCCGSNIPTVAAAATAHAPAKPNNFPIFRIKTPLSSIENLILRWKRFPPQVTAKGSRDNCLCGSTK